MTATTSTRSRAILSSSDIRSFALAMLVTLLALAAGFGLKTAVEGRTSVVALGGATSTVPYGWIVTPGGGELAFVASDPEVPTTTYSAWFLPASNLDLESAALEFAAGALGSRNGLTVTTQGAVRLGDADAYEIAYAFVDSEPTPELMKGTAWVFARDGRQMAVVYEAPSDRFDRDIQSFRAFAATAGPMPQ